MLCWAPGGCGMSIVDLSLVSFLPLSLLEPCLAGVHPSVFLWHWLADRGPSWSAQKEGACVGGGIAGAGSGLANSNDSKIMLAGLCPFSSTWQQECGSLKGSIFLYGTCPWAVAHPALSRWVQGWCLCRAELVPCPG